MSANNFLIVSATYLGIRFTRPEAPSDPCTRYACAYRGMLDREITLWVESELKDRVAEIQAGTRSPRSASSANPAPSA